MGWEEKEEMGARQFSARAQRSKTDATLPLGKDDQRQNWCTVHDASADGRQTVPCRPNKKSFWQNGKSAKAEELTFFSLIFVFQRPMSILAHLLKM